MSSMAALLPLTHFDCSEVNDHVAERGKDSNSSQFYSST